LYNTMGHSLLSLCNDLLQIYEVCGMHSTLKQFGDKNLTALAGCS